jgi:hypothetical protein
MLQGMFGQKLAQHFSLLESSSLVLGPRVKAQIALTRMRMPNGLVGTCFIDDGHPEGDP